MRLNERIDCKNKTVVPCRIPCIRGPSSCRHAIHNSRRKAVSGQRDTMHWNKLQQRTAENQASYLRGRAFPDAHYLLRHLRRSIWCQHNHGNESGRKAEGGQRHHGLAGTNGSNARQRTSCLTGLPASLIGDEGRWSYIPRAPSVLSF